jgi:hypothetical protein
MRKTEKPETEKPETEKPETEKPETGRSRVCDASPPGSVP